MATFVDQKDLMKCFGHWREKLKAETWLPPTIIHERREAAGAIPAASALEEMPLSDHAEKDEHERQIQNLEAMLNAWAREWPASIHLPRIDELSGGALKPKTLSNHMSRGTGPDGVVKIGRKAVLTRDKLIEWVRAREMAKILAKSGRLSLEG